MSDKAPRILVIRRDNIGDLVCTTPLFAALRNRFPHAHICALVTRYSRAVLDHNPAIDRVYAYTKDKHLDQNESFLRNYWGRLRLMLSLRRERFDICVLAAPGYQLRALALARWIGANNVVGFVEEGKSHSALIDRPVPWKFNAMLTETEDIWRLAGALGIEGAPGPLKVVPNAAEVRRLEPKVDALRSNRRRVIGIHLSARKPSQRWSTEHFVGLMNMLHTVHDCAFVLLWAPGSANDPRHPGDDAKALTVVAASRHLPLLPMPTTELAQLIAAISLCDEIICADGGAMHLAAGTGKPIVCLFGKSGAVRWRPWGVPYRLLQKPTLEVSDISVEEVARAYCSLRTKLKTDKLDV